ncbi:MAG: DUF484 family protein [Paracoccaceae bacterium]|nr:DUF484 family protein [Paracoccaceae bacterium]
MSEPAVLAGDMRDRILQDPDTVLSDPDVMRALIAANERARGANVVDLRGIAMDRLEDRLTRLEETHKSVVSAAYENMAGTNQIHRAILSFLEPLEFEQFIRILGTDIADILRVGRVRLVLESHEAGVADAGLGDLSEILAVVEPGYCEAYIGRGRPARQVTLRPVEKGDAPIYGPNEDWVGSEACILLDFGEGRLPGMLAFAAEDRAHFTPHHGTDLLSFLGGVFERAMRRWLG